MKGHLLLVLCFHENNGTFMINALTLDGKDSPVKSQQYKLLKCPTGIKGFDEISFGGLPRNRPTLVAGTIGSGKTFFSMEFLLNGIMQYNENGVFMTFEEKTDELITNVSSLKYNLQQFINDGKIHLEHLHINQNEVHEVGNYNIDGLFVRLDFAIKKTNAKRIVLDSMDTLFLNLDKKTLSAEFHRLFSWLKDKNVSAIITAELGDTFLTRLGLEENIADCVIELTNRVVNQISTRRLRIIKYRGSSHANNEYPFIIDPNGLNVFPLASRLEGQNVLNTRVSSGIKKLDEMLDNLGFYIGSSILISGTAGTGKTSIISSFARSICSKNSKCLVCLFEEAPKQLIRNMLSIGISLDGFVKDGLIDFYYARPSLQDLELHFMEIKEIIKKTTPSYILLDPITNLMTEGPNSDVRSMLTRFVDYLKMKNITVMFTAAITLGSISRNPSDEGISSMVDTWIMLDDLVFDKERKRTISVMKSRGMIHSQDQREFIINTNGIEIAKLNTNNLG